MDRLLEILAPARTADIAIAAVTAGADAVYIGASSHGARQDAANSVEEIARVVRHAHIYGAKVYATVNTIIYDREIPEVERLVWQLYAAGVDALIVQDMAMLRMHLPPIELHASTQCDIRTPEKARFLADAGFTRIVLARELSLNEIRAIAQAVPGTEIEVFVHGALCVSYSGDCRASFMAGGRSANRGECAQICRLPYVVTDTLSGAVIARDVHALSLRDLNRLGHLAALVDAGVTSFKIEGRLKDEAYVKNAVGAYSKALDKVIEGRRGLRRASAGTVRLGFTPNLEREFNRGFTPYFLSGKAPSGPMATLATPKVIGEKVARVLSVAPDGRCITIAEPGTRLANGDGISFTTRGGSLQGFRLNRVDGNRLYPAKPVSVTPGTWLYRNSAKEHHDAVEAARTSRTLAVDMMLRVAGDSTIVLEMTDERGVSATVAERLTQPFQQSVSPQKHPRRQILTKLGGTPFHARQVTDAAGDLFIPASALAALRRRGVEALLRCSRATYRFRKRLPEAPEAVFPGAQGTTVHDNVSNSLAEAFYRDHGADSIIPAAEVDRSSNLREPVMTTRYCLRRELGICPRLNPAQKATPLTLTSGRLTLEARFDCSRCGMDIYLK